MTSVQPALFPIGPDLQFDRSIRDSHANVDEPTGVVLFSPKIFTAKDVAGGLERHRLEADRLISLGHLATDAKARFHPGADPSSDLGEGASANAPGGEGLSVPDLGRSYDRKKDMLKHRMALRQEYRNDESSMAGALNKSQLSSA